MVALIDADILVYEAAFRAQQSIEWEPGEFTHSASLPDGQQVFSASIADILDKTGCTQAILALTDSDRDANFRRAVWPAYKAHRDGVGASRPLLYSALRQWAREAYAVKQKHGIEADDTIGIMATGDIKGLPPVEQRVICSVDKDLLTIPGLHFNWRRPEEGVFDIPLGLADFYHMLQTLVGDSTDGYPGCPGIGPKRADVVLGQDTPTLWDAVVGAFEKKGLTEDDALVQARCARILRADDWDFEKEEPILWTP